MNEMQKLAAKLPHGIGYEWTGLSFQERLAGSQAPFLYAISVLVVFLSLAALYESWSIAAAVIMVVPLGVVGALIAANSRGLPNDVYFQVGSRPRLAYRPKRNPDRRIRSQVTGRGEDHDSRRCRGFPFAPAPHFDDLDGLHVGCLAASDQQRCGFGRHAIGTGVIGGMLTATFLAIFMIPMFFVVISKRFGRSKPTPDAPKSSSGVSNE